MVAAGDGHRREATADKDMTMDWLFYALLIVLIIFTVYKGGF